MYELFQLILKAVHDLSEVEATAEKAFNKMQDG